MNKGRNYFENSRFLTPDMERVLNKGEGHVKDSPAVVQRVKGYKAKGDSRPIVTDELLGRLLGFFSEELVHGHPL
jgi:hypothetical protein